MIEINKGSMWELFSRLKKGGFCHDLSGVFLPIEMTKKLI
jgi:hypothetical protein